METDEEETMRRCKKCGSILWESVNENTVKVFGTRGQDYEIGFNYILATCKDCGMMNSEISEVAEALRDISMSINKPLREVTSMTLQDYPYHMISSFDRNVILGKLSEKQRKIFEILGEIKHPLQTSRPERTDWMTEGTITLVSERMGISEDVVRRDIDVINREVKLIKPDFLGGVTQIRKIHE
jgi:hypothetical protein